MICDPLLFLAHTLLCCRPVDFLFVFCFSQQERARQRESHRKEIKAITIKELALERAIKSTLLLPAM